MSHDLREKFLTALRTTVRDGTMLKLTLGKPRGADAGDVHNLFVRPLVLRGAPHFSFVWRHATRDITKNHEPADALAQLEPLIGTMFHSAHLFTNERTAQLEYNKGGEPRLTFGKAVVVDVQTEHDRAKSRLLTRDSQPWLHALGITNDKGVVREGMADKHRQIHKFVEILSHLTAEIPAWGQDRVQPGGARPPDALETRPEAGFHRSDGSSKRMLHIADMGCGKGYLTFATNDYFNLVARQPATVRGVEARPELVDFCNRVARDAHRTHLHFEAGTIADAKLETLDVLIALHACDTATDDALARGIAAGATLLVVAPCCQKELRPQLKAAPVLAPALSHGIFQERHAEFATDALRALLLEWAGYDTKVFEFISTEHTAKNLMIAATKRTTPASAAMKEQQAATVRELAGFYGVKSQALARHLNFNF